MRLLFISAYYPPHTRGGAELSTYYLAEALKKRGHVVDVLTANVDLPFQAKPLFEKRFSQKIAKKLTDKLQSYDIIHAHDFRSAAVVAELGLSNSVVTHRDYAPICGTTNNVLDTGEIADCCSIENLLLHNPRLQEASLLRKPFRVWQYLYNLPYRQQVFKSFKKHVFISHAQQELINRNISSTAQQTVIYNPISEEYLTKPLQKAEEQLLTYIGTVDFYKGVGLLIKSWKLLSKEFQHARLQIIGEGARHKEYQDFVYKHDLQGSIVFKGRIAAENIISAYDESAMIIAPHIWIEPFGRTVAEAMARGKVVVTANAGGPAEMIQNTVSGILFERNSVQALVDALRQALQMPVEKRTQMGDAAQQWVKNNLTANKIAEQYEKFYQLGVN